MSPAPRRAATSDPHGAERGQVSPPMIRQSMPSSTTNWPRPRTNSVTTKKAKTLRKRAAAVLLPRLVVRAAVAAPGLPAAPFVGAPPGCVLKNPTGTGGCITHTTSHALEELVGRQMRSR